MYSNVKNRPSSIGEDFGDVDDVCEGELDPLWIGDHRKQCVDALHLRVPQVVARPAGDGVVPGDVRAR